MKINMSLRDYILKLGIDRIKDDKEFEQKEHEAILEYLIDHEYVISEADIMELKTRIDIQYYYDWKQEYEEGLCSSEPWYVEKWYDDDLIDAMRDNNITITKDNLRKFRNYCCRIFEDKSERNEALRQAARELFI